MRVSHLKYTCVRFGVVCFFGVAVAAGGLGGSFWVIEILGVCRPLLDKCCILFGDQTFAQMSLAHIDVSVKF